MSSPSSPKWAHPDSEIPFTPSSTSSGNLHDVYPLRHSPLWGENKGASHPKGPAVKLSLLLVMAAALLFAAPAIASTGWTAKDMQTAASTLRYPKAGAQKVACRGKTTFRCVATYKHGRRVFYAQWQSMGGWLCAGAKASSCKPLRHGFIPTADTEGSLTGAAQLAARGYMAIHYNDPQPYVSSPCSQTGAPSAWTFCYKLDVGSVSVTITLRRVKTGYVTTAAAVKSP